MLGPAAESGMGLPAPVGDRPVVVRHATASVAKNVKMFTHFITDGVDPRQS